MNNHVQPQSESGAAPLTDAIRSRITHDARDTLDGTARYIHRTADYGRADRLWPAEPEVFSTNPMSIAYGASGPALFLHDAPTRESCPAEATAWMLRQSLTVDDYPPGLYLGLSGIAFTFLRLGMVEKAEEVMRLVHRSPLAFEEHGLLLGASGWGLAGLHLFRETGRQVHLDWAVRAGDHLLKSAESDGGGMLWRRNEDGRVHYGYGYGASGIALFLLHLFSVTGVDAYRSAATRALDYDLARRTENDLGWNWQRFEGDTLIRPYWIHGNAGIGSVAIRLHDTLGEQPGGQDYLSMAQRIADDSYVKCTAIPGLFEGMAGIAEFMVDMYRFTGDGTYMDRALDLAETIMWFRIERHGDVAWPGRWLDRISDDYAVGGAGIGLFLGRLLHPAERLLLDLPPAARPAAEPSPR